jgi:RNA polymerase sigma-70 factor, ECF subfamily
MSVGKVYALCLRLIADPVFAEKLTVEIYLTTWRNISSFREDTLFSSWLTGITTYTVLNWLRSNEKAWSNLNPQKTQNEKNILTYKNAAPIDVDIQSLPDRERFVFVLHDIEKYADEEVADLLTINKQEVNGILQNAYRLFNMPREVTNRKAYIDGCLNSLPEIILPGNDIWKYISYTLRKEQAAVSGVTYEYTRETQIDIKVEEKKKKFGFLNWKKK